MRSSSTILVWVFVAYVSSFVESSADLPTKFDIERELQPQGAFSYPSYHEVVLRLHRLADSHPDLVDIFDAQSKYGVASPAQQCKGSGGVNEPCKHWFVRVTNKTAAAIAGPYDGVQYRPHVFLSGNLHGNEWVGPVTVINMLEMLLSAATAPVGSPAYNEWMHRLVNTRTLIALTVSNPAGYDRKVRTEDGVDPNRDFPIFRDPHECMVTTTARAINEVWLDHLMQASITFHGGMQAIAYEWGLAEHEGPDKRSESPDDAAQYDLGGTMRAAAGQFHGDRYPSGPANTMVYPVDGGMEDWAYAGSWDPTPNARRGCTPGSHGGYPAAKTSYSDSVLRSFNVLVEAADDYIPAVNTLGSNEGLEAIMTVQGPGDGHVPRNIRLTLAVLDLVEPYVHVTGLQMTVHTPSAAAHGRALRGRALQQPAAYSGPEACVHPGHSGDAGPCGVYSGQYESWTVAGVSRDSSSGQSPATVAVWAGWDVGGAMHVDATAALIGSWDARIPPSLFYTATPVQAVAVPDGGQGSVSQPSPAFVQLLTQSYGLTTAEAEAFTLYLDTWQRVAAGTLAVADLPASYVLGKTAIVSGNTRWTYDSGAGGSAVYNAGKKLANPAFTTRYSACVRVLAGVPESMQSAVPIALSQDEPCNNADWPSTGSGRVLQADGEYLRTEAKGHDETTAGTRGLQSPFIGTIVRPVIVLPFTTVDGHWAIQRAPQPPNTPPQAHMTNVRINPSWSKSNNGYTARGRHHFAAKPLFFGIETRVTDGPVPSPSPSQAPSASPSAAPSQDPIPSAGPSNAAASPSSSPNSGAGDTMESRLPLLLGASAMVLCGAGVVAFARRRARGLQGATRLDDNADDDAEADEAAQTEWDGRPARRGRTARGRGRGGRGGRGRPAAVNIELPTRHGARALGVDEGEYHDEDVAADQDDVLPEDVEIDLGDDEADKGEEIDLPRAGTQAGHGAGQGKGRNTGAQDEVVVQLDRDEPSNRRGPSNPQAGAAPGRAPAAVPGRGAAHHDDDDDRDSLSLELELDSDADSQGSNAGATRAAQAARRRAEALAAADASSGRRVTGVTRAAHDTSSRQPYSDTAVRGPEGDYDNDSDLDVDLDLDVGVTSGGHHSAVSAAAAVALGGARAARAQAAAEQADSSEAGAESSRSREEADTAELMPRGQARSDDAGSEPDAATSTSTGPGKRYTQTEAEQIFGLSADALHELPHEVHYAQDTGWMYYLFEDDVVRKAAEDQHGGPAGLALWQVHHVAKQEELAEKRRHASTLSAPEVLRECPGLVQADLNNIHHYNVHHGRGVGRVYERKGVEAYAHKV